MELARTSIGILAATAAAIGILTNLFVFSYELFVGRTISPLPVIPAVALGVALGSLRLVRWDWAIAIATAYLLSEMFTSTVLVERLGARRRNNEQHA